MKHAPHVAVALLLLAPAAQAAGFSIEPIGEPGNYMGCVAIDGETEMGFVGVAQTIAVIAHSKLLRLRKGDAVDGTWNIDGAAEQKLDAKTDTADTVSAGLPATPATFALLANGNAFSVTMGATSVEWSLEGSSKALKDLGACMDKNVKP